MSLKFSEENHGSHTVKFKYLSLLLHRNEIKGLGTLAGVPFQLHRCPQMECSCGQRKQSMSLVS